MTLLRQDADRLELLIDPLTAAIEKAPNLAAQVPGLVSGASDAYPGWKNKLQMMRTLGALMDTSNKLKHSVVNLKHVLDNARGIITAVHR